MQPAASCNPRDVAVDRLLELIDSLTIEAEDAFQITNAFFAVLDLAAASPGGWHALIDGIKACGKEQEVLSFLKGFTMVLACEANTAEAPHCVHDPAYAG